MLRKLMLRLTVKDGERAFLLRNGRFERVLGPGRHRLFDPLGGFVAELHQVVRTEYPAERFAVLKAARPDLAAEMFEAVETKADETAIVSLDGRPSYLVAPWQTRVFWKVVTKVEVERIDIAHDLKVAQRHLAMIARERNTLVAETVIENHEAGLLCVEGRLVERLAAGRHAYWIAGRRVEVKRLDLRPQAVEITAQEMLTKHRISLRVTLTALRRIVDPERVGQEETAATRFAPQHREADGGQPAPPAAEGARVDRAAGGEGRPYRPSRRRRAGPRCAAQQARAPEGERDGMTRRVAAKVAALRTTMPFNIQWLFRFNVHLTVRSVREGRRRHWWNSS
ncbi:MAG: hypothetical protein V7608_2296 [Hyphomicrobiales bacterium]